MCRGGEIHGQRFLDGDPFLVAMFIGENNLSVLSNANLVEVNTDIDALPVSKNVGIYKAERIQVRREIYSPLLHHFTHQSVRHILLIFVHFAPKRIPHTFNVSMQIRVSRILNKQNAAIRSPKKSFYGDPGSEIGIFHRYRKTWSILQVL